MVLIVIVDFSWYPIYLSWWRYSITFALSLWILISLLQKEHF